MMSKINSNKRLLMMQALKKSQSPLLDETMNIVGERVQKGRNKDAANAATAVDEETNPLDGFEEGIQIQLNKVESSKEIGKDKSPFNNAILS